MMDQKFVQSSHSVGKCCIATPFKAPSCKVTVPLLVQRALNKPTLLEACIMPPGGCCVGLTNTSLRKKLMGFPAQICSALSEYWDRRVSMWCRDDAPTASSWALREKKELLSAGYQNVLLHSLQEGQSEQESSTKVTEAGHSKGIDLLHISSWFGFVALPAVCERFGFHPARANTPSVCRSDTTDQPRCQGSVAFGYSI